MTHSKSMHLPITSRYIARWITYGLFEGGLYIKTIIRLILYDWNVSCDITYRDLNQIILVIQSTVLLTHKRSCGLFEPGMLDAHSFARMGVDGHGVLGVRFELLQCEGQLCGWQQWRGGRMLGYFHYWKNGTRRLRYEIVFYYVFLQLEFRK